jgi:vanillate monooxygenase
VLSRTVIERLLADENASSPQRPVIPVAQIKEAS